MSFKGDLSTIGLAEVFQMISMSAREGTLVVQDAESKKAIYFGKDGVQLLSSGRRKGIKIGDILVRAGKISVGQLRDTLERQQSTKKLLGEELIAGGLVTQADIDDVVRSQIEEEIYDLFLWKKAMFEFIDGAPVDELRDPDSRIIRLAFDVNSLLLEAVRRTDEWTLINQKIPSMDCVYIWSDENAKAEEEGHQNRSVKAVAQSLDGQSSVNEVVEASLVPKFEVCKIFVDFLDRGRVRLLSIQELTTVAKRRLEEGRREKGFRLFQVAALIAPEDAELLGTFAHAMETEGLIQDAARMYVRVGNILKTHGQKKDALAYFQRAVSLNPDDAQSKLALFEIHLAGGNVEDAVHTANEVIGAALKDRDFDTARAIAEQAVEAAPQNTDIRLSLARVYHATGEKARRNEVVTYLQKNLPVDAIAASKLQAELAEMQDSLVQPTAPTRTASPTKTGRSRIRARQRKRSLVVIGTVVVALGVAVFGADYVARNTYRVFKSDSNREFAEKHYDDALKELRRYKESWVRFHPLLPFEADLKDLESKIETAKRDSVNVSPRPETDAERLKKLRDKVDALATEASEAKDRGEIDRQFKAVLDLKEMATTALELATTLKSKDDQLALNARIAAAGTQVLELSKYISDAQSLVTASEQFEKNGKYKEACEAIYKLLTYYFNAQAAKTATYPLRVHVKLAGAKLFRDDQPVELKDGVAVLRLKPKDIAMLRAEKAGFKPATQKVEDPRVGVIDLNLVERVVAWTSRAGLKITAPIEIAGASLYVACDQVVAGVPTSSGTFAQQRLNTNVLIAPKVVGETLFVVAGRQLIGLNMSPDVTERVVFTFEAEQSLIGQPIFSNNQNFIYMAADDKVLAIRAKANPPEVLWSYALPRRAVGNLFDVGGQLVAVCGDGTILGLKNLDAAAPEEAWKLPLNRAVTQGAALNGTTLVVAAGQSLVEIDCGNGQEIARATLEEATAPIAFNGTIAAVASNKRVHVYQAGASLQLLKTLNLPDGTASGAAIIGPWVIVGSTDKSLYAFNWSSGELEWKCPTGGAIRFAPVAAGGRVYFGSDDGYLRGVAIGEE